VLSPRAIYAIAGLLGVASAIGIGALHSARTTSTGQQVLPQSEEQLTS
jgi:hypothetical protein